MTLHGDLEAVGDGLARDEAVVHAVVVHGDAVADADGRDLDGHAAGHVDAGLHSLGDLVEVVVAGDDVVAGVEDGDERALHLLVGEAIGLQEAPVRSAGKALLYGIASELHLCVIPSRFLVLW